MADIKALLFDWGDTVMKDFEDEEGPMCYWSKVECIPGIESALRILSEEYICIIGSNANESNAQLMGLALERVNIKEYFDFLFTSKEIGFNKPDTQFFNEISSKVGVSNENVVMIGNDYIKDICGAKSAGMKTIYLRGNVLPEDFKCADKVITTMNQLIEVIRDIKDDI